MPRNGSGGYGLPAGNPVVTGTTISSTDLNNTMTDLATAMAGSVAADGQTAWTGNQNANGNRLTGLAAPVSSADGMRAGDAQTGVLTYFTTGGTGSAYTLTPVPAASASTAGLSYKVTFHAACAAAPTINISGLGAINLVKLSSAGTFVNLAASDVQSGHVSLVTVIGGSALVSDFSTQGRLIGVRQISATGTYTPTAGTNSVVVELVAGGGAGGGALATGAGQIAAGGGGGAGGYAKSRLTTGFAGVTVTIGAGGVAAAGGNGGNGGSTSFGAVFSATGGNGGSVGTLVTAGSSISFVQGTSGGAGSGGNLYNAFGQTGFSSFYATSSALSGAGGASVFGGGGAPVTGTSGGSVGGSFGSGGGGGSCSPSSGTTAAGGTGGAGLCLVWEYA